MLTGGATTLSTVAGARVDGDERTSSRSAESRKSERQLRDTFAKLPLGFIPNAGQTGHDVLFHARGANYGFNFTRDGVALTLGKLVSRQNVEQPKAPRGVALDLEFVGADKRPTVEGGVKRPGKVNYLVGPPSRWRTRLPTYGKVVYRDLWPRIDVAFKGERGTLKYEFLVKPGGRVDDIRLAYRGARRLSVGPRGALLIHTALGVLRDSRPLTYQRVAGTRTPLASRYTLDRRTGVYGFDVHERYDRRQPLVIDPGLEYSTFLGGLILDAGLDVAVDPQGEAYVTGTTNSPNFPATPGAFDPTYNGTEDVFVSKLNASGSALEYSTFLGGTQIDEAGDIAVDGGNAYVTGYTGSPDFPTTPGAFDQTFNGGFDAFAVKLSPDGSALAYSTFLGGGTVDMGGGIAVSGGGNAYVTGRTSSADFPTTPDAFDNTFNGAFDAFVVRLNASGSALVYSTFLGGSSVENNGLGDVAIDAGGQAYVTGDTQSADFPTTPGAFDNSYNGADDAFATKLSASGSSLVYSTFLGGAFSDGANAIAVDPNGNARVAGATSSVDYPTTPGAFDNTLGLLDAFVSNLNRDGTALLFSTFLGGSALEFGGSAVAVDSLGNTYVTGTTTSADFPTTPGAFDNTYNGDQDAYVSQLNSSGSALLYSTFLGGALDDRGFGVALDADRDIYVAGLTFSADYPTTPGAFDNTHNGFIDAFVTKIGAEEPVCEVNVTQGGWGYTLTGSKGTFGGTASLDRSGVARGQQEYQDHSQIRPVNFHSDVVEAVTCTEAHARVVGTGHVKTTAGEMPVEFTIDVEDLGEPGAGRDTYHITLAGAFVYDSGEMVLHGGNVQIHRQNP